MSLNCEWLVLCERVLHDSQSNNLTLVTCLEAVAAPEFPAAHPRFAFAARYRWNGDPLEADVPVAYRLVRRGEDGQERVVTELEGTWSSGAGRARVFVNFSMLMLERPEVLTFRLDSRWDSEQWREGPEVSLDVIQLELGAGEPGVETG